MLQMNWMMPEQYAYWRETQPCFDDIVHEYVQNRSDHGVYRESASYAMGIVSCRVRP